MMSVSDSQLELRKKNTLVRTTEVEPEIDMVTEQPTKPASAIDVQLDIAEEKASWRSVDREYSAPLDIKIINHQLRRMFGGDATIDDGPYGAPKGEDDEFWRKIHVNQSRKPRLARRVLLMLKQVRNNVLVIRNTVHPIASSVVVKEDADEIIVDAEAANAETLIDMIESEQKQEPCPVDDPVSPAKKEKASRGPRRVWKRVKAAFTACFPAKLH